MKKRIHPLAVALSAALLAGAAWAAWQAVSSSRFSLRQIEWPGYPADAPLPLTAAVQLAEIPLGRQRLVTLELEVIEKRLLASPWVKAVRLERKLPDTLAIHMRFREPVALLETGGGRLGFVESDGNVFHAPPPAGGPSDLLLLHGVKEEDSPKISEMLEIAGKFKKSLPSAELSGLSWTEGEGYRALVRYARRGKILTRTMIELGESASDPAIEEGLPRVPQILDYLSSRSLAPRSILIGDGKKIVVRVARGS